MFPIHDIRPAMGRLNDSEVIGNDTIDVMIKGCFHNYDQVACVRNGIMCGLLVITMIGCVVRISQLHTMRHPTFHHYVVFYTAIIEGILLLVHWLAEGLAQLDFAAGYLKLVQFLVVSHFYWTLATRAMRKESLTNRVIVPVYVCALMFFSVIVVLGTVDVKVSWIECQQPYWLLLSCAEFLLVQLFVVAGFFITRRINQIIGLDSERSRQKRDLWSIIVAFEVSSLVAVSYDGTLIALGDAEIGCSGVFKHAQWIYSPVFGTFMLVKFLVPIWAMLCVFHPIEGVPAATDVPPTAQQNGSFRSVFIPSDPNRYRPLHNPITDTSGSHPPQPNMDWFPEAAAGVAPVRWSPASYPGGRGPRSCLNSPRFAGFTPSEEGTTPPPGAATVPRPVRRSSSSNANLATICEDSEDVLQASTEHDNVGDKRPFLS